MSYNVVNLSLSVEISISYISFLLLSSTTLMQYESPLGGCQYSGPIDELNLPNGIGEAFFNDGRYYQGGFEHGVFSGEDCYFRYANGDEFKGKFRKNQFYYGTYTIASDQSYYVG